VLSGRALKPISNIIDLANRIEPKELSRRLPQPSVDDEVGRLVATLNHMLARIEDSFEAMKRFTSDASHELRSPLATLRNLVDVTLEHPRSGEEKEAALRSIGEEVDRIRTLVEDLLLLARADSGRVVMQMKPVSLAFILEAQVEAYQAQAQARLTSLACGSLLPDEVLGNERWLMQVVGNLLGNAINYTPMGGSITVDMARATNSLQFSVSDTGPGLPEEDLERVFERFFRTDPSRSRGHVQGQGLGLAIAAWVVGEHQGSIRASNRPEGGAKFTVTLPLVGPQG
jgi:two-component system OmpR family sensor kinase